MLGNVPVLGMFPPPLGMVFPTGMPSRRMIVMDSWKVVCSCGWSGGKADTIRVELRAFEVDYLCPSCRKVLVESRMIGNYHEQLTYNEGVTFKAIGGLGG